MNEKHQQCCGEYEQLLIFIIAIFTDIILAIHYEGTRIMISTKICLQNMDVALNSEKWEILLVHDENIFEEILYTAQ